MFKAFLGFRLVLYMFRAVGFGVCGFRGLGF